MRTIRLAAVMVVLATVACHGSSSVPTQPTQPTPSQGGSPAPPAVLVPIPNPNSPFDGAFTLTLQIGPSCSALPDAERTRVYDASIGQVPNRPDLPQVVTLSGAHFLSGPICTLASGRYAGIGCNQFLGSEDGEWMGFFLENNNDEAHGAHIVEQTASGGWVEITGSANGTISSYSSMDVAGTGTVWYCPTASSYPFPCSQFKSCQSTDLHLSFRRK